MCDICMKHGAGGKWYLNARHYSEEVVAKYDLREFLLEQYKHFEQIPVRKIAGVSPTGLGYKLKIPIIGRIIKKSAEFIRRRGTWKKPVGFSRYPRNTKINNKFQTECFRPKRAFSCQ